MSNKETLQIYNSELDENNIDLTEILNTINNLPEAGNGTGEDIANELTTYDTELTEQENVLASVQSLLVSKSGKSNVNVFIQNEEPLSTKGIWIKSDNKPVKTIEITSQTASGAIEWFDTDTLLYKYWNGGVVSVNGLLYIFGGGDNRTIAYSYNPKTQVKTRLADIPYGFYDGGIGAVGTSVYLFGGNGGNRLAYKYDISTNTYVPLAAVPYNYVNGYACAVDTNVYLFSTYSASTTAYKYDTLTDEYTKLTNIPYNAVYGRCAPIGTDVYLFGGSNASTTAYKYDTLTDEYTKLTNIPYNFFNGGCCTDGSQIYLIGSEVNGAKRIIYQYNPTTDAYTQLANLGFDFYQGTAVSIGSIIYLIGNVVDDVTGTKMQIGKAPNSINPTITNGVVIVVTVANKYATNILELYPQLTCNFTKAYRIENGKIDYDTLAYYGNGTQWRKIN